jgi:zinc/manganese transport system substrate-binding protein
MRPAIAGRLLALPALLALQACRSDPPVEVVAADGALCDLTQRLAANNLGVACLLGPEDDPHQLQLNPAQTRQLRQAKLVLINGYGLTPALQQLPGAVKVAEIAVPNSPELTADQQNDHQEHAHSHGHHHGDQDPHVWHDPRQAAAMTALVSERLERLAPNHAAQIQARAKAMQASLLNLHQWNLKQFSSIPEPRILASSHRAFVSLANSYELEELPVVDAMSSSDALRPQALADAVSSLKSRGVRSLFAEQVPAPKTLERISSLSGVPIAPQPLRADTGGANLMSTLTNNTCLIVDALGGRCDRAGQSALIQEWERIR